MKVKVSPGDPQWIAHEVVLAIHEMQLAEHGGPSGIRDPGLLESALMRPQNVFLYSPSATLYDMAAAYAIGLAKNHAFADGNKRTAWLVCALFLELNGISVVASQEAVVVMVLGIATGSVTEEQFSAWLRRDEITACSGKSRRAT